MLGEAPLLSWMKTNKEDQTHIHDLTKNFEFSLDVSCMVYLLSHGPEDSEKL